jgi:hypothetical protein
MNLAINANMGAVQNEVMNAGVPDTAFHNAFVTAFPNAINPIIEIGTHLLISSMARI